MVMFSTKPSKVPLSKLEGRLLIKTGCPKKMPIRLFLIASVMAGLSRRKVIAPNWLRGERRKLRSRLAMSVTSARDLMFDSTERS